MEYIQGAGGYSVEGDTAITLGKFDGLHRGHQKLIRKIREYESKDCKSVIFTLNSKEKGQILTGQERAVFAETLGADILIDCPLIPEITGMDPEEFVREILVHQLHARHIVVGSDFRFGYQRKGDTALLRELQRKYGFCVEVIKKQQYQGRDISSTYVREELALGHVENVNMLLGYPFFVSGEILHSKSVNAQTGLTTANLMATTRKLLPPNGVYVTETLTESGVLRGLTSIGICPVEEKHFRGIETHFFECWDDLFGENIKVQFLHFLHPEMSADSAQMQHQQFLEDVMTGKEYFSE